MDVELGTPESPPSASVHATDRSRKRSVDPSDTPERGRKRIAKACDACRRLKEKCQGGERCIRCARVGRECTYTDAFKPPKVRTRADASDKSDFLDPGRIRCLERIVSHYTGLETFEKARLRSLSSSLTSKDATSGPVPTKQLGTEILEHDGRGTQSNIGLTPATEASYTGELSHSDFSRNLQRDVQNRLPGHQESVIVSPESPTTPKLHESHASVVLDAASVFPPPQVASFLFDVFFVFGQTNYLYVDEQSLREKLSRYYAGTFVLSASDASWVCTVLMMFAMGVQFSHLSSTARTNEFSPTEDGMGQQRTQYEDDAVARKFHDKASKLIPGVVAIASMESVQAFGLLAVYALPVDAAGLSCTYLGIAIKIATQNGMYLKYNKHIEPREMEMRRRIWWTVYTLERRICVLHGRPVSIARSDVEVDLPSNFPGLPTSSRIDTMPNVLAMIKLTDMFERARDLLMSLKRAMPPQKIQLIQSVVGLKDDLQAYWQSLPMKTYCRDLDPKNSLFRFNIHLQLTFHLVYIFIGRSYILKSTGDNAASGSFDSDWADAQKQLVDDCISSAIAVIDLCQTLDDEIGLARTSYTEFTSCCAAVLGVLAARISNQDARLRRACSKGIKLLKKMSVGVFSNNSEKLAIEALEMAVQRLNEQSTPKRLSPEVSSLAYAQFRDWAMGRDGVDATAVLPRQQMSESFELKASYEPTTPGNNPFMMPNPSIPPGAGFDLDSGYPEFDFGGFASVPGLGDWLEFGLH